MLPRILARLCSWLVIPVGVYFYCFIRLTANLIDYFSVNIWTLPPDSYVQLWNLWWVNTAITELHQSPWYTNYVEFPAGASLWGHSLEVANGLMAIVLLRFMPLFSVYNFLLLFSFIVSGVTMFWLAYYLTRSGIASLIAGFIFTFSNYHFAHMLAHLDVASMEWIPLFILCWYILLQAPNWKIAFGAALVLFLNLLSNYYYFVYCILAAILMFAWFAARKRDALFLLRREYQHSILVLLVSTTLTSGPIVFFLLLDTLRESLGGHPVDQYSLDVMALVVPSVIWRFGAATQSLWVNWVGNMTETNVAIALGSILLAIIAWLKRKAIGYSEIGLWFVLLIFFLVMSFGPVLHVNGREYDSLPLPYQFLSLVVPPLSISGVPVRMISMVILALAVINALAFTWLLRGSWWMLALAAVLFASIVLESIPTLIPNVSPEFPAYVFALRNLPDNGGVLDRVATDVPPSVPLGQEMYYQTVHRKPLAFGYLSRTPQSVIKQNGKLSQLLAQGNYIRLCRDYGFGYVVIPSGKQGAFENLGAKLVYRDADARIYDLSVLGCLKHFRGGSFLFSCQGTLQPP